MKRLLCLTTAVSLLISSGSGLAPRAALAADESQVTVYFSIPLGGPPASSEPHFGLRYDQELPDNVTVYGDPERLREVFDLRFNEQGQTQLSFGGISMPSYSDRLYQDEEDSLPGSETFAFLPPICFEDGVSYGVCLVTMGAVLAGAGYGIYTLVSDDDDDDDERDDANF